MHKILLVTVGGSAQPILTAIDTLQPDRVIFFCSAGSKGSQALVIGEGTPCEIRHGAEVVARLPNIPTQAGLSNFQPGTNLVLIQNPDDLSECYCLASNTIRTLRQHSPDSQIVADYTGGTKTMSVALAMAVIDYDNTLYVTTSTNRENLIRVERGEATERARTAAIAVARKIEQFLPLLLGQYNYSGAIAELKNLLQVELPAESRQRIRELKDCCAGFDAWDRFNHTEAWQLLQPYMKRQEIQPVGLFLKRVISSRAAIDAQFTAIDSIKCHGYEIVEDLLLNAERRAAQERYDDAVGRLYRALELLGQIRLLQTYSIKTGDVDLQKLPEFLHKTYTDPALRSNDGKIQLALTKSYMLLSEVPDDPLGKIYQQQGAKIQNALQIRNYSLFAHGFKPITKGDYQAFSGAVAGFIQTSIGALVPTKLKSQPSQFPRSLDI